MCWSATCRRKEKTDIHRYRSQSVTKKRNECKRISELLWYLSYAKNDRNESHVERQVRENERVQQFADSWRKYCSLYDTCCFICCILCSLHCTNKVKKMHEHFSHVFLLLLFFVFYFSCFLFFGERFSSTLPCLCLHMLRMYPVNNGIHCAFFFHFAFPTNAPIFLWTQNSWANVTIVTVVCMF